MVGLVPAIHVLAPDEEDVDARVKPGMTAVVRGASAAHECQDAALSRKYGSTGPCTLMVSGLPWRSFALPAVTRTQPSLTQYSSTLVFSTPLKRIPTSRASSASL